MKVLDLLEEIEEIADTSSSVPLTAKIMVDREEILEIVKDIKIALPDEIQQAQFIKNERQRILDEAKNEYEMLIKDAEKQAEILVDTHEITTQAKHKAMEITKKAEDNVRQLKIGSFEYVDKILFDFQEKMEILNSRYFGDMFNNLQNTFDEINDKLLENRNEIKELAYKTRVDADNDDE
jgi:vacuolar-type H+-ATPase subunit H